MNSKWKAAWLGFRIKVGYALWALKRINDVHLMDVVVYRGERCTAIQGRDKPYWNLIPNSEFKIDQGQRLVYKHVHESDFKIAKSFKRHREVFMQDYKFRMGYWFDIDLRRKMEGKPPMINFK